MYIEKHPLLTKLKMVFQHPLQAEAHYKAACCVNPTGRKPKLIKNRFFRAFLEWWLNLSNSRRIILQGLCPLLIQRPFW